MGPGSTSQWGSRQVEQTGMRSRLVQFRAIRGARYEEGALPVIL